MSKTITAVFDGEVLRPEEPKALEPNTRYFLIIASQSPVDLEGDAWDVLEKLIGTVDAPPDWSIEHDHYLYGTPKRFSSVVME